MQPYDATTSHRLNRLNRSTDGDKIVRNFWDLILLFLFGARPNDAFKRFGSAPQDPLLVARFLRRFLRRFREYVRIRSAGNV